MNSIVRYGSVAQLPKPLVQGCVLPVLPAGHATFMRAEILSIDFRERIGDYAKADFYVHFQGWNKRLDQRVTFDKLKLEDIEWPKEKSSTPSGDKSGSHKKRSSKDRNRNRAASRKASLAVQAAANRVAGKAELEGGAESLSVPSTPSRTTGKAEDIDMDMKVDFVEEEEAETQQEDGAQEDEEMEEADGEDAESAAGGEGSVVSRQTSQQAGKGGESAAGGESQDAEAAPHMMAFNETQTYAEEMERLRQGGSVSMKFQAEAYKMKNINRICVGLARPGRVNSISR